MARLDAHAHIIPPDYRDTLERRGLLPYKLPPWSRELLFEFMDGHQIDQAVLSVTPPGVSFGDPGLAAHLSRLINEETSKLVQEEPTRLGGMAILPLPDVDCAILELNYALDVLGLDGVMLLSNVEGVYLGDPRFDPVFEELNRRSAYVMVHPHAPPAPPALPHHPIWLYEYPFDTTRAVVQMLYSGTLERCPAIRLQLSHLGGAAPFLAHRIASLQLRDPDLAAAAPAGALAYLARLYYDTGLADNDVSVSCATMVAPLSQIVFGSDWPYAPLAAKGDPAPGLAHLGDARALVDAGNAAALVPRLFRAWSE